MSDRDLERDLEWEATTPITIELAERAPVPIHPSASNIIISRDEGFRLRIMAKGILQGASEIKPAIGHDSSSPAGTTIEPAEMVVESYGASFRIYGFMNGSSNVTMSNFGRDPIRFTQLGEALRMSRKYANRILMDDPSIPQLVPVGTVDMCTDWFVNGPHSHILHRWSKRQRIAQFTRERTNRTLEVREPPMGNEGADHIVVATDFVTFSVTRVPSEHAPKWLHATAIEYHAPVPEAADREAIAEIVSFVLGRRLVRFGTTDYDESGSVVSQELIRPAASSLREQCDEADQPPVPLGQRGEHVETILAGLVSSYMSLREDLKLRNALWAYWAACEAATPIDLAIFRAAVEALKSAWFKSTKTKSKGRYLEKDVYERVVSKLIDEVREQLHTRGAEPVARKIAAANQMGSGEQISTFFDELGLPIGKLERAAMKSANIPAHGTVTAEGNMKELSTFSRAYRTLFERGFLKILGFDGVYIDRTELGYPEKPLLTPAGPS